METIWSGIKPKEVNALMKHAKSTAWIAGRDARLAGLGKDANLYARNSKLHYEWNLGYFSIQKED